jgi:hypothetical protein
MRVQAINGRSTAWNYLLALPCLLLLVLFTFDLVMALSAPICTSAQELDSWCLPIGWEGPFADDWGNRSRGNALINATLNFAATLLVLAICVRRFSHPPQSRLLAPALLQLGLVAGLFLKGLALNNPS